jgi:homoserine kinase
MSAQMTWPDEPVTVRVPATSANLGPGFDSFGLALSLHDTVRAQVLSAGLDVQVTGAGADELDRGERHLVVRAIRAAFDAIGRQPPGLLVHCRNGVPQGYGLGSSAAAIVAGLVAARALAVSAGGAEPLPDQALLELACELEGHPDNVAACLCGGLTVAWATDTGVRAARLTPLAGLAPVLCIPAEPLPTVVARQALPAQIPHAGAAANSARAALLIAALTGRPELLLPGTEDFLHQSYRAATMPGTTSLIARLRLEGIAAVVSGAGPAVLALTMAGERAGNGRVAQIAAQAAEPWQVLPLAVDTQGAQLVRG